MSTSPTPKSPSAVLLELVDELLGAGTPPSERSLAAIRNQLGVLDKDERTRLFKVILNRVPERQEDESRWKTLACIMFGLQPDKRLKCEMQRALAVIKQMWERHHDEPGASKDVVLALRDLNFYWER